MAVPDFQTMMLPLLTLAGDGQQHTVTEAVDWIAQHLSLSGEDRVAALPSGGSRLYNRVCWANTYLKKAGLLQAAGPGRFCITERGRSALDSRPPLIDIAFLEARFPEMSEFRRSRSKTEAKDEEASATFDASKGSWNERPEVSKRVREVLENALPDEKVRRDALELFAGAIETADEESGSAWYVRETEQGVRLMVGRLVACEIARYGLRASVIGPLGEQTRASIGIESDRDEEFKSIPNAVLITFPADRAAQALYLLKDALAAFVEMAVERVRSAVSLQDHAPEVITYIEVIVGRDLPQPHPDAGTRSTDATSEESGVEGLGASKEPQVRGRAPIFELGQRSIASLVSDIEREVIALPDLQRPFVWEDIKVRDLLDSLFLGFPVGTLVFWQTANEKDARALGEERPSLRATTLVIDGQQRLTSLYAVMRGVEVIGKDGATRRITIAFRPRDGRFEVADAAIRNDPEFLPNVTELWNGSRPKPQIRRDLINGLRDRGRAVDEKYEDAVERSLDRASGISDYRFPTVDIRKTASSQTEEATEEDVAEIFVRINNQGTRLGQADFVLTLLSVFHGDLRDRIEERAKGMSRGAVVEIDTQQLLRAVCGVAFTRARMSAVYRYLRGIDPVTGDSDPTGRLKRLKELEDAAAECMEPTPWRDYLLCVQHAGFISPSLIASKNAIVNAFAFYIRGRKTGVPKNILDELIARWVFGALVSARYSGSSETVFEQDLARVANISAGDASGFVSALDGAVSEVLTGDFWTVSLVSSLETQKSRAPAALAFRAAQIVLGARALFSDQLLRNLLDPPAIGNRSACEVHHLFPDAWLREQGIGERRRINQVANLADVGWHENTVIGARRPGDYVPRLREKFAIDDNRWGRMCAEHALPLGWENLEYDEFLRQRRKRMADIIRVAFRQLGGEHGSPPLTPPWFLPGAEAVWQRIAEAERALRAVLRDAYSARFGVQAAAKIEESLPERDREVLGRALRARPTGSEPLSVIDYLYLAQLPPLMFVPEVWEEVRQSLGGGSDLKQRLQSAVAQIAPVRNEIAHVREIDQDRLLRATVACSDILKMIPVREAV
jgi:hypothetical protein